MRWSKEGANVKLIGVDEYGTQVDVINRNAWHIEGCGHARLPGLG